MSFATLGLCDALVNATETLGFTAPMPIQEQAIPALLAGERDFIGLAQTGTGKTGAFGLPMLQRIDAKQPHPQGVVICPTRELCLQITDDLQRFAAGLSGVRIVAVYGGASISDQVRQLKSRSQVIVATPGRLRDLISRKALDPSRVSHVVLDEADEMLNMGFQEDIDEILSAMPAQRRIWLFSATMPSAVATIAGNYLEDPLKITVGGRNQSPTTIAHTCHVIHHKDRYAALRRVIDFSPGMFALVFCRTRLDTQKAADDLVRDGYPAEALHGDLSQPQRDAVMRKFRAGLTRILVATDVAARGLDVDDITHVIHYTLPDDPEVYTHRSGRTARAGKSGASIALITPKETYRVRDLERRGRIRFSFEKLPDGDAICRKQLLRAAEKIAKTEVDEKALSAYLPEIYDALGDLTKEDLIQRMVSGELNRLLGDYRNAGNIDAKPPRKAAKSTPIVTKKERFQNTPTQRFFINVGRLDKINEGTIVRLICDRSGIRSALIGQIDLKREFSFFDVEKRAASKVKKAVHNATLDGRVVQLREVFDNKPERKTPVRSRLQNSPHV